jgi:hypothetical protein
LVPALTSVVAPFLVEPTLGTRIMRQIRNLGVDLHGWWCRVRGRAIVAQAVD